MSVITFRRSLLILTIMLMLNNSLFIVSSLPPDNANINRNQIETADYVFYNGTIITVDDQFSLKNTIAINNDSILAIGNYDQIISTYGQVGYTQVIDLEGKAILPGWIDGHSHMFDLSRFNEYGIDGSQELALSYGYTTNIAKYGKEDIISILQEKESNNELKMRVNVFASYNEASLDENNETIILNSWFPENPPVTDENKMLRIPGIKIFVDGSFQPHRGAWAMSDPFPDEDWNTWLKDITSNRYGDLYLNQTELEEVILSAQNMGYQVAFHAMGDRAIETVVNSTENVTGGSNTEYRHQIEHSSYLRPDLLQDYVSLDMMASVRGYFPSCQQTAEVVENFFSGDYFNKDWYINRYNMTSSGVHNYLETDFGWTHEIGDQTDSRNIDPYLNLFGLVTRAHIAENGSTCLPQEWMNADKISVEDAIKIMTIEGARSIFQESVIGSLERGKFADLIIIPTSPLDVEPINLKELYTILTMVGGNIEFQKNNSGLILELLEEDSEGSEKTFLNLNTSWLLMVTVPIIWIKRNNKKQ